MKQNIEIMIEGLHKPHLESENQILLWLTVTGIMGVFWGFHVDILKIQFAWDVTLRQWVIGFRRFKAT
jgi:hypothetical protein